MDDPDAGATLYQQLRRRGVLLAWLWLATEGCRLVSASATLLFPWFVLVFLGFEAVRRPSGQVVRLFGEWRLYAFAFGVSALSFTLWRLSERGSRRLLRILRDPHSGPRATGDP